MDKALHIFSELDAAAEDVLTDKQTIIDLSRKSNETRRAIRTLEKEEKNKSWVCVGQTFIKIPTKKATEILKRDQLHYNEEIDSLRNGLKQKVNKVRDLEGKPEAKAFNLKALSKSDLVGIVDLV